MKTVTYRCDKCGKVIGEKDQLWNIAVVTACEPRKPGEAVGSWVKLKAQWCRACMERTGMVPLSDLKNTPPTPNVTLEDILREMIADVVAEAEGGP